MIKIEENGYESVTIDTDKVLEYIKKLKFENNVQKIIVYYGQNKDVEEPKICKELNCILMHRIIYIALRKRSENNRTHFELENEKEYILGIPVEFDKKRLIE